jgi:hypothetical protein
MLGSKTADPSYSKHKNIETKAKEIINALNLSSNNYYYYYYYCSIYFEVFYALYQLIYNVYYICKLYGSI